MLNKNITSEEKINISNININDELLIRIKYLKDNNKLDLINSCPEDLLLSTLPGETITLINYFDKNNLPKINGIMKNLEIEIKQINGETRYYTKGDANEGMDDGYIVQSQIVGITNFKIAYLGYPTIWIRDIFN